MPTFARMKRINILLTIVIAVVFAACSKPSLEDKAKERIRPLIDSTISGSEVVSYSITEEEVVYSGDSICIIHFDINATNDYGEKHTESMEYVIMWTVRSSRMPKAKLKEVVRPISRTKKPLLTFTKDFFHEPLPDDKVEKERMLRIAGPTIFFFSWKDVQQ